jgi:hypothetical protein
MKSVWISFFTICAILITAPLSAQKFEGKISIMSNDDEVPSLSFTVKGKYVLMEPEGKGNQELILLDRNAEEAYFLSEMKGMKIASKSNLKGDMVVFGGLPQEQLADAKGDLMKFTVTKEKKVIRGYECIKVKGESSKEEGEAWVTKEVDFRFADITDLFARDGKRKTLMTGATDTEPFGFIMEAWSVEKETGNEYSMKVFLDESPVPGDLSNILKEYKVVDFDGVMRQIRDAQGDPERIQEIMQSDDFKFMQQLNNK